MPTKIIAFGHKSRVGKDTAAKFTLQHLRVKYPNLKIEKRAFAWKLKELAHDLYGWAGVREPAYYEYHEKARTEPLPLIGYDNVVKLWIALGNALRSVYADTWIKNVIHTNCDVLIISDLRFPNEIDMIRNAGESLIIRVTKQDVPLLDSTADQALDGHESKFDITVENDSTLNEFHDTIISLVTGFVDA